jgi:mycothiol synthase
MGEIYVIGVDPDFHGRGWGRALTQAGLDWLAGQGLTVGMLYVDADNTAAVSMYRSMGFSDDHVDRSYLRAFP